MVVGRFFNAFGFVAVVPECSQACNEHYQLDKLPPEISDKIAGMVLLMLVGLSTTTFSVFQHGDWVWVDCLSCGDGLDAEQRFALQDCK